MPHRLFHPAVARWFGRSFAAPTEPQARAWPFIRARRHTLIAAPTGSGKTLAAFLSAIDDLVRQGVEGRLTDATQVVYVSPLKALSNDIRCNLVEPLAGIRAGLAAERAPDFEIRTLVRTGDTPAAERTAMIRRPPHIVVTTPESLYILLTSEGGRRMLSTARTVIVDEIHALVADKRGSHLALSLERLDALAGGGLARIGLSATQKPIEEVARFLVGTGHVSAAADPSGNGAPACEIVDAGHARALDLAVEVPRSPLEAVMSAEVWTEIHDRIAGLIASHRTTLVFVNTRRLAERLARHLGERIGPENVTAHHGSIARAQRLEAERRLKAGELKALVATASLELGIDIGDVDLVCQVGTTRSIATLLQRVGRSGHGLARVPKGRIFPLSLDELAESAALLDAVRRGELDRLEMPRRPLDILAQQIVAAVACEEWTEEALFALVRRAWPYRDLSREEFDAVVRMLADGFSTRRGRRGALLHRDGVNGRLRGRRGARLTAITSGGAIPDTADYEVVLEPTGAVVGSVNEDFAVESIPGNIFQLGNASWRILRIEPGKVRVEDARGQPPNIPFWLGEAPARTAELSAAVSRLRGEIEKRLGDEAGAEARAWLEGVPGLGPEAYGQIVEQLAAARAALGALPTAETIVLERFFDETGGMQLVVHSPRGGRINRAWGLALRKRFCRKFNFELQAAATENAIVLSLGTAHSFPLEEVFSYLRSGSVRDLLVQALLDAPVFPTRWRWNVGRALAVPRWRGGRKLAPQLQRIIAEDLLAAVFPDQIACAENLAGEREIPDHPLVAQTIRDCLEEAMDVGGLEALLRSIEEGSVRLIARDLTEPSPLALEVLTARPYAFLDDAPLEERRTQAVISRRWIDPATAADLGRLDEAAIARVREEAWPAAETPDELHDALQLLGFLTGEEIERGPGWSDLFARLVEERRAARLLPAGSGGRLHVAAERLGHLLAVYPDSALQPLIAPPAGIGSGEDPRGRTAAGEALVELLRGRLEALGPVTEARLAAETGLPPADIAAALAALEAEGFILRGRFTPGSGETEWCCRRLLSRIHRYTLDRLRREIEPVPSAVFMRFLIGWQGVGPEERAAGPAALSEIVERLEGFEAPAAAWEEEILPARVADYEPAWLDALCLSGRVAWMRLTGPRNGAGSRKAPSPVRTTPIALVARRNIAVWRRLAANGPPQETPGGDDPLSHAARAVLEALDRRGACFFDDLAASPGLLRSQIEDGLGELVARGLAGADSFAGLRALLAPSGRRRSGPGRRRGAAVPAGMESAGRWSRLSPEAAPEGADPVEIAAGVLLRRYGVVFRRLLEREAAAPPWRELLRVYRRLEARGEIRGGRFVDGFSGEQFARPEAVGRLRAVRRSAPEDRLVSVSAADPLNLIGIVTPGARVASHPANRILFRDGEPVAVLEAGEARFLVGLDPPAEWRARNVLLRRAGAAKPGRAAGRGVAAASDRLR